MGIHNRVIVLLVLLTLGLAGCASDEDAPEPAAETQPAAEPAPAAERETQAPNAEVEETEGDEADLSAESLAAFKTSPVVSPYFDSAYGYALFPTIGKGGLIIGAAHGKGSVFVGGEQTGTASMTEVSIGLQAGGEAISEIIFFEDESAYADFASGNFEFDAEASAVAITAGASAKAGTGGSSASAGTGDAGSQSSGGYRKGMATFTYSKGGLMADASIGGQKFKFEPLNPEG